MADKTQCDCNCKCTPDCRSLMQKIGISNDALISIAFIVLAGIGLIVIFTR